MGRAYTTGPSCRKVAAGGLQLVVQCDIKVQTKEAEEKPHHGWVASGILTSKHYSTNYTTDSRGGGKYIGKQLVVWARKGDTMGEHIIALTPLLSYFVLGEVASCLQLRVERYSVIQGAEEHAVVGLEDRRMHHKVAQPHRRSNVRVSLSILH